MTSSGSGLPLVLLWHHHQPLYRDLTRPMARGSYRKPWVRLHALRDYYGMAALGARYPALKLTINFSPCLLWQIEDHVENGASDQALELTLTPAETLDERQRETVLSTFFEAESETQILPHRRYRELFEANQRGRSFSVQDLRDLQMWFSLAWFAAEFREGPVTLVTGETVEVARFVQRERGFDHSDVEAMVAEQRKLLRAILPLHRQLQDDGRIEVAISPFYHPILPLLIDTTSATLDRPGATLPRPFRHPEDAEAQVQLAVEAYQRWFGRRPRGTWPAEGAVSQSVIPILSRAQLRWTATDQAVLGRSGRWGYHDEIPEVRGRVYRAEEGTHAIAMFFRDTELSDDISFRCHDEPDPARAAQAWLQKLRSRTTGARISDTPSAITVALDGENAWGSYRDDGRPFLEALYRDLAREGQTITPSGLLEQMPAPAARVHDIFTASWIDESGSAAGVDLGTWIGEPEENQAWNLLGTARDALCASGLPRETAPAAYQALYAAEGSDWFWWYGDDQQSGQDASFDELFRTHLRAVYLGMGTSPPAELARPIVPREVLWTAARPVRAARVGERLMIRVHCPGTVSWVLDSEPAREQPIVRTGGALAGTGWYQASLVPFAATGTLHFTIRCMRAGCDCHASCCAGHENLLRIWPV
jgi:alpha-amylase/alpha-mannosidase (GH57 family)